MPANPIKNIPIDLKITPQIDLSPCSSSTCADLVPIRIYDKYDKQSLGLVRRLNSDIWSLERRPLPTISIIVKQIQNDESPSKIQQAVDWLTEDLDLGQIFDEFRGETDSRVSWVQACWDGHLLYPEDDASSVPLPISLPFEEDELDYDKYSLISDTSSGMQVSEDGEAEQWVDWDDVFDGWSEDEVHGWQCS